MKTYYFSRVKPICLFLLFVLINALTTSCSSFKNSSYYDNDGIYGSPEVQKSETRSQSDAKDNQYKDYFGSLQNSNEKVDVLTDVDNYHSTDDSNQAVGSDDYKTGYAGWGNNSNPLNINVYGNNWAWNGWSNYFYGPSYVWGWNSWYGMNYGWGWNNWYGPGYGYYGWGWNNNYYNGNGYYNNHNYSQGIRGDSYRTAVNRYNSAGRNNPALRSNNSNNGRTNRSFNSPTRNQNIFFPNRPNQTSTPRIQSPTRSENVRPRNSYPTRSEQSSPREYSSPRSYDGGGRSSGGGGFGGGGGGRSGSGNGRR